MQRGLQFITHHEMIEIVDYVEGRGFNVESMSKRNLRDLDYWLIVVMVLLSIISTIAIYTATYGKAKTASKSKIAIP